ncbi:MAG: hypothetical protein CVV41_09855 [Candidatus Riflebacteria bacterium HGW-Riflebacteria-1]|jgi:hypothetical protein|nr:MAG: hypothetical protein CVV41_09855 [Candidatus Riflebacteria bacterium HGW-Riflebacteria-1]
MTIKLAGTFFRYGFSFDFVNQLLGFLSSLEIQICPVRVDAAVDFVSMGERYIPVPTVLPQPGSRQKSLFYGRVDDKILTIIRTNPYSGDSLLRVYDKLTDEKDPHFLLRHPEYEGFTAIWRLEFEFKGDTGRAVYINSPESWSSYDSLYREILGQCFRRYSFQGFEYPKSQNTSYIRKDNDDIRRYNDAINKMRSNYNRAIQLEKRIFCKRPVLDTDSMSVFDLMAEHEEKEF